MRALTLILLLLLSVPAHAGSIGYTTVSPYMDWTSDCSKPYEPSFIISDVSSYNYAVDEFNSYVSEVENYIQCIKSEAQSDSKTIIQAIENAAKSEIDEAINAVESAQSSLEMQKAFLN
ncbi:hypothetical protein [Halodesulfovibrio aestuarii]|uniref:Uncharacterized protein n=1 Tax=Halodesulfovibrio aestuarii TaxID=126333 RepID=A0ABV4JPZ9_9BACT